MEGRLIFALAVAAVLLSALPSFAAAEEAAAEMPSESICVGYVQVTVVDWTPDLTGAGAGLFTSSSFDLAEFFGRLAESLSDLLGI